jgi:AraC-like DNA-binding protein
MNSLQPRAYSRLHFAFNPLAPIVISHNRYSDCPASTFDVHYELEVGIVLKGGMTRHYPNTRTRLTLTNGDIWLTCIWEPHGFSIASLPCEVLVLVVRPEILVQIGGGWCDWLSIFARPPEERILHKRNCQKDIVRIGRKLAAMVALNEKTDQVWARLYLLELLAFFREDSSRNTSSSGTIGAYARLKPSLDILLQKPRFVTVAEAARVCTLGRNTFSSLFKTTFGLTFAEFALRQRLSGAARQLAQTRDSLKKVALDWGFTDTSHLHWSFVKCFGMGPNVYRVRAINNPE